MSKQSHSIRNLKIPKIKYNVSLQKSVGSVVYLSEQRNNLIYLPPTYVATPLY